MEIFITLRLFFRVCSVQHHNITVAREVNEEDGTLLHEFWVLRRQFLEDGESDIEGPPLEVHVAPFGSSVDIGSDGLPLENARTTDSCRWEDCPQEVKRAFGEEIDEIQRAFSNFSL